MIRYEEVYTEKNSLVYKHIKKIQNLISNRKMQI